MWDFFSFSFKKIIEMLLIYRAVLVSKVQQSDSVICVHSFFQIFF